MEFGSLDWEVVDTGSMLFALEFISLYHYFVHVLHDVCPAVKPERIIVVHNLVTNLE